MKIGIRNDWWVKSLNGGSSWEEGQVLSTEAFREYYEGIHVLWIHDWKQGGLPSLPSSVQDPWRQERYLRCEGKPKRAGDAARLRESHIVWICRIAWPRTASFMMNCWPWEECMPVCIKNNCLPRTSRKEKNKGFRHDSGLRKILLFFLFFISLHGILQFIRFEGLLKLKY